LLLSVAAPFDGLRKREPVAAVEEDMIVTVATYAAGLLGAGVLVVLGLHAYAWWTIRELD
jgi:hypothetical protein